MHIHIANVLKNMDMCFQIELTTNVILTKKILDIKIKKAKKIKEKDNLVVGDLHPVHIPCFSPKENLVPGGVGSGE